MTRMIAASLLALAALSARADQDAPTSLNEKTVAELQDMMRSGQLSSAQLTQYYIDRILQLDQNGPGVNARDSTPRC